MRLDDIVKPFDSTSPFHHNKTNLNCLRALSLAVETVVVKQQCHTLLAFNN